MAFTVIQFFSKLSTTALLASKRILLEPLLQQKYELQNLTSPKNAFLKPTFEKLSSILVKGAERAHKVG